MLNEANDFREECDALQAVLAVAPTAAWSRPTQFKGWTFDDIIGHLHMFDVAAGYTLDGREVLAEFFGKLMVAYAAGKTLTQFTREWLGGSQGPDLLERWHDFSAVLAARYLDLDPGLRVAWGGPDMSTRSLISARQMEVWAHGQAAFDALGLERAEHDRIRNIAVIGVNTFGWTFVANKLPVPAVKPYVRLTSPSGAVWEWNDPAAVDRVEGPAVDFCRVVTQTRNVADSTLRVTGEVATAWMSLAQCFAGPPNAPPAPGARFLQR